ncbi:Hypothetical predicted protein [Paramuricea clavata]|uniref:Uncharacterized protein n=1 Tax=Paramuricea clavata TaxID=317549 RepID=A0A6S7FYR5_PARCT|nr:Hypothetical predicted protein [Paramuricea clavata]
MAIKTHSADCHDIIYRFKTWRRGVEALKIEQKVNEDEVATWNSQVETELEKADDDVKHLEKWQDDCKLEKERNAFEEKLKYESLQSLKKLDKVKCLTMVTIEKLPGIRGDLVRSDSDWETWNLDQLAEAVRLWIWRNPVDHSGDDDQTKKRRERKRMYLTN